MLYSFLCETEWQQWRASRTRRADYADSKRPISLKYNVHSARKEAQLMQTWQDLEFTTKRTKFTLERSL